MEAQEIFDKVKRHLLTQGRPAMNEQDGCVYLSAEGLRCAAGCLIPDGHPGLQAQGGWPFPNGTGDDATEAVELRELADEIGNHTLVQYLQCIHDHNEPLDWREKLRQASCRFGLIDTPMEGPEFKL